MKRKSFSTGLKWEPIMGFSRAVRIGNLIEVAGTTSTKKDGHTVGENSPYDQTIDILRTIENALKEVGVTLEDVIRTRVYVTDLSRWEEVAEAHGEFFKDIKPVSSLIGIKGLMNPLQLVEIEATAYIHD